MELMCSGVGVTEVAGTSEEMDNICQSKISK